MIQNRDEFQKHSTMKKNPYTKESSFAKLKGIYQRLSGGGDDLGVLIPQRYKKVCVRVVM